MAQSLFPRTPYGGCRLLNIIASVQRDKEVAGQKQKANQFAGKSLSDLNALRSAITARLDEFLECGNLEQCIAYARLQTEITEQVQTTISARLEEVKQTHQEWLKSFYQRSE